MTYCKLFFDLSLHTNAVLFLTNRQTPESFCDPGTGTKLCLERYEQTDVPFHEDQWENIDIPGAFAPNHRLPSSSRVPRMNSGPGDATVQKSRRTPRCLHLHTKCLGMRNVDAVQPLSRTKPYHIALLGAIAGNSPSETLADETTRELGSGPAVDCHTEGSDCQQSRRSDRQDIPAS